MSNEQEGNRKSNAGSARWTKTEKDMLRNMECPPGRTLCACRTQARKLNIKFVPPGTDPEKSGYRRGYTEEDLEELRNNRIPEGMTEKRARYVAHKERIHFRPVHSKAKVARDNRCREIIRLKKEGLTYREIGERMGISFQWVHMLMVRYLSEHKGENI